MKKSKLFLFSILSILSLSACFGAPTSNSSSLSSTFNSSSDSSSSSLSIERDESSQSITSKSSSSLSSSNSSKPSSNSTTSSSKISSSSPSSTNSVIHLGNKTITEVRQLCNQYVTSLNASKIGVDMTHTVTISGLAIDKVDLVKTKKSFGLDISAPAKVLLGDETGYIGCASKNGDGKTFFGKVGDYAGKDNSKYEVTGYLSIYLGQPELYIPDETFKYVPDMALNVDISSYSKADINIDSFYENVKKVNYNCAGHGYGDIYNIKSVKCIENRNSSVYIFSDGNQLLKVIKNNTTFSVGSTYDIVGYLSTENWAPALQALKVTKSSVSVSDLTKDKAREITVTNFKKYMCSQEDTNTRFDSYMDVYRYVYKSEVYVGCYTINGKYYVTISDKFCTTSYELTNRVTAHTTWNMMDIANDNYWNVTWQQIEQYCPVGEYVNENTTINFYYSPYYLEYSSSKPIWKVFAFNEFLD